MIDLPDDETRPAAPSVGPVSGSQALPGRHLAMIHDEHRRTMAYLADLLAEVEAGRMPPGDMAAAVRSSNWLGNLSRWGTLCGQQCQFIHFHHSIEDQAMFPALREKASAFAGVLSRLEEEHKVVHALLVDLIGRLEDLDEDPDAANLERAADTFRTLRTFLLSHFGYEEDSLGDALGVHGVQV